MKAYLDAFFSMGVYAYVIIGIFILAAVFGVISSKANKNSMAKWLANHEGAVKVSLKTDFSLVTQKELYASVVEGEAAIFYADKGYVVWAMPGDIVLEVTYTYTRPGVLHKKVSTTWGPARIELHLEKNKNYHLTFDKKEEKFNLEEE